MIAASPAFWPRPAYIRLTSAQNHKFFQHGLPANIVESSSLCMCAMFLLTERRAGDVLPLPCSAWCANTLGTARSRTSGQYVVVLFVIPSSR